MKLLSEVSMQSCNMAVPSRPYIVQQKRKILNLRHVVNRFSYHFIPSLFALSSHIQCRTRSELPRIGFGNATHSPDFSLQLKCNSRKRGKERVCRQGRGRRLEMPGMRSPHQRRRRPRGDGGSRRKRMIEVHACDMSLAVRYQRI